MTTSEPYDLVGGPFAVIESDPGVFTALIQKLGVKGLEVIELYDIEPWAVDHLNPHGLIFCYMCTEESDNFETGDELDDPDAERVWFANQLSDDACSSQAILNVLLNRPQIYLSDELSDFKKITDDMSPVCRPADIRGGMHAVAATTIEANKHDVGRTSDGSPAKKKRKTSRTTAKSKQKAAQSVLDSQEAYHFIGYVPARDKVWELDGLRSCALEVGTLPPECRSEDGRNGWMDIVRPALRMKMQKYTSGSDHIRYSLLAIVDDRYQKASDELELLKRERHALERRLNNVHPEGWSHKVESTPRILARARWTRRLPSWTCQSATCRRPGRRV
ncbi:hypothetical protein IEO21_04746 [Rhodonia placenta]|uniref:ubiquitinyl hydrolase 1 n=1 Tax=Rhodonia placenta TaxID=104341 RepID=A0A8H7P3H7_9APHY|nr:hypothetical protein IEO21_04746 [Postia placenta]